MTPLPEDSISDQIYKKFEERVKTDALFDGITAELVSAMKQNEGKIKLKEILRGKNANTHP